MGYAAAVAFVLFAIILAGTVLQLTVRGRKVDREPRMVGGRA